MSNGISYGTALGPFTGADLGEWHRADLLGQAEHDRLVHEVAAHDATPRATAKHAPRRHRRLHVRLPAAHSH